MTKAIIIAAGMGSRLGILTRDRPKCLLQIGGKTILENLLKQLRLLDIKDIALIVGYQAQMIKASNVTFFLNENYQNNNILHSLMYARSFMDDDVLVSYSDIWLEPYPILQLLRKGGDCLVSVDTDWEKNYIGRMDHPVAQAENALYDQNGTIHDIGKHIVPEETGRGLNCGEFIGLCRLSKKGCKIFRETFDELDRKMARHEPFQHSRSWERAYLTDFFCELLKRGHQIVGSLHRGGWSEIDTPQDYQKCIELRGHGEKENEKKLLGSRILAEANDLKRTIGALARDIDVDERLLQTIVNGDCEMIEIVKIIDKMGAFYPIDKADLLLPGDDTKDGVKIMRATESETSSRIFKRKNRAGDLSPYYEYRDTVMSRLAPYRPEWIKELRFVSDADPHNRDVVYNNGHFLHQTTFFVGPVNFYWEVNGKKYCVEMNTGDSNYITPFWPHSFATRSKTEEAYILAVTFGGDVKRAQKELYALGARGMNYVLDFRKHGRAVTQLIQQHMANENMTVANLKDKARAQGLDLDVEKIFADHGEKGHDDLKKIAGLLNIEVTDLEIPLFRDEEEVVVRLQSDADSYFYPGNENKLYKICPLARSSKMPLMKGFNLKILTPTLHMDHAFSTSLHTYVNNYSEASIDFSWEENGHQHKNTINPHDSLYIQPFVRHAFSSQEKNASLFMARVSGSVNLTTQRELSYFSSIDRVFKETICWFN